MKRASKTAAASKVKAGELAAASKLPAGYESVQGAGFPDNHDFEKSPILQGTVTDVKTVSVKKGRKMEDTQLMTVADSDGVISAVWNSAGLKELFSKVKKGDSVFIEFLGMIPLKGKQSMKKYSIGHKPAKGSGKK